MHPLDISYVRSEINPQFVGIVPPTDVVVVVSFDIEMEFASGGMTLCIPYSSLEPIKDKLHAGFQSDQLEVDHAWIRRFYKQLLGAEVELVVELGNNVMKGRDLIRMGVGDVLQLAQGSGDEIVVKVEGIPKFKGHPGVVKGNVAIQITNALREERDGVIRMGARHRIPEPGANRRKAGLGTGSEHEFHSGHTPQSNR